MYTYTYLIAHPNVSMYAVIGWYLNTKRRLAYGNGNSGGLHLGFSAIELFLRPRVSSGCAYDIALRMGEDE